MQRKSKLILLIAGIVGFVVVVLLLISKPGNPVTVTLQSYTNGCAIITITNRGSISFEYVATKVEHKIGSKWHDYSSTLIRSMKVPQSDVLGPFQQTSLTITGLVYAPSCPWRFSVFYLRPPVHVQVNSVRSRAAIWFDRQGFHSISRKLFGVGEFRCIELLTPELIQLERNPFGE